MYWVYILYSEKGQRYYIGQTQDVAERLECHNCGYEKSTSPYRPYKLVCKIEKPTRSEAMQLEKKLKNLNTEDLQKFIQKYGGGVRSSQQLLFVELFKIFLSGSFLK